MLSIGKSNSCAVGAFLGIGFLISICKPGPIRDLEAHQLCIPARRSLGRTSGEDTLTNVPLSFLQRTSLTAIGPGHVRAGSPRSQGWAIAFAGVRPTLLSPDAR